MDKFAVHRAWLGIIVSALLTCTASAQPASDQNRLAPDGPTGIVTVPFVSVRSMAANGGLLTYGPERGETSSGECEVDLDARKRRQMVALRQRPLDELLDGFDRSGGRVTVYVHGYNVGFEQSCREAALLQVRAGIAGRLLLFSWPAEGKVSAYLRDVGDIEWSTLPLRSLLLALIDALGSRNINVIGHSLGAKGVVDAVTDLGEDLGELRGEAGKLGRVILIAPDLDGDLFVRDYAAFRAMVSSTTLYVSAQDRALKASRTVRSEPRLGEGGSELLQLEGIDIVEVSQRRWKWGSGHTYHLDDDAVAADLRNVLSGAVIRSGDGPRRIGHGSGND